MGFFSFLVGWQLVVCFGLVGDLFGFLNCCCLLCLVNSCLVLCRKGKAYLIDLKVRETRFPNAGACGSVSLDFWGVYPLKRTPKSKKGPAICFAPPRQKSMMDPSRWLASFWFQLKDRLGAFPDTGSLHANGAGGCGLRHTPCEQSRQSSFFCRWKLEDGNSAYFMARALRCAGV